MFLPRALRSSSENLRLGPGRESRHRIFVAHSLQLPESDQLPGLGSDARLSLHGTPEIRSSHQRLLNTSALLMSGTLRRLSALSTPPSPTGGITRAERIGGSSAEAGETKPDNAREPREVLPRLATGQGAAAWLSSVFYIGISPGCRTARPRPQTKDRSMPSHGRRLRHASRTRHSPSPARAGSARPEPRCGIESR